MPLRRLIHWVAAPCSVHSACWVRAIREPALSGWTTGSTTQDRAPYRSKPPDTAHYQQAWPIESSSIGSSRINSLYVPQSVTSSAGSGSHWPNFGRARFPNRASVRHSDNPHGRPCPGASTKPSPFWHRRTAERGTRQAGPHQGTGIGGGVPLSSRPNQILFRSRQSWRTKLSAGRFAGWCAVLASGSRQ